jgi:hypothetical protein
VATNEYGLEIVNISNPASLMREGGYKLTSGTVDFTDYAVLAAHWLEEK